MNTDITPFEEGTYADAISEFRKMYGGFFETPASSRLSFQRLKVEMQIEKLRQKANLIAADRVHEGTIGW